MSVGVVLTKQMIDNEAAAISQQLNQLFKRAELFRLRMDATIDATLTALGYSGGDIAVLRSAYRDNDNLGKVRAGVAYVAPGNPSGSFTPNNGSNFGYDFTQFTKQLDGIGY